MRRIFKKVMNFFKASLFKQGMQTQNNELFCKKTKVENQTNETVSGNKTENKNCVTNIHNYGSNIPLEIKEYIDKRIAELHKELEEIKTNFIPKTAKPSLRMDLLLFCVRLGGCPEGAQCEIKNIGNIEANNIVIKLPKGIEERQNQFLKNIETHLHQLLPNESICIWNLWNSGGGYDNLETLLNIRSFELTYDFPKNVKQTEYIVSEPCFLNKKTVVKNQSHS